MSIGGIMRTSVSGMNAQATRLGTVAENIANSDTTGYKQSQTEFSSLLLPSNAAGYNSGAVEAQVRTLIGQQGGIAYTGNDSSPQKLDLAVDGNGFLVVSDGNGGNFLTRAGAFTQQADGTLVNAAGFTLMGYPVDAGGTDFVLNGFTGLQEVNLKTSLLSANPSTEGILTVPLDKDMVAPAPTTGTYTQSVVFGASGGTSVAGDKLRITIAIDGTAQTPIDVVSTGAAGISSITSAQIVAAINAAHPGVASLDSFGNLTLTSNSANTSTASSIALTAVSQTDTSNTVLTTPATIVGLSTFTAASGSPATALPSDNTAQALVATATTATSIVVYNNSGEAVKLDIYYTKTSDADNTWEVAVFDSRDKAVGTATAPFPYSSTPLATATLDFNDTTFTLQSITPFGTTGATQTNNEFLNINLGPIGGGILKLDIGDTTQFTGQTQPLAASVNGNAAEVITDIKIGVDGTITATFDSGTTRDLFRIPLASVTSPDSMDALAGNVYKPGTESGTILMGFGGSAGFGKLTAGALEDSTVDLANELTTMIESQRSYTANSKVFQTGSEILDVLVNLKR